jgi:hypothetical protein
MKGCLWIIAAVAALIWAFSDSKSFFILLGILVFLVILLALFGKKESPATKPTIWTPATPSETFYTKDFDYEDRLYDVSSSSPDSDEIYSIRYEDNEFMETFEEKISSFEFANEDDFDFWYENEVEPNKIYTDKYLRKRMRRRMKEECIM